MKTGAPEPAGRPFHVGRSERRSKVVGQILFVVAGAVLLAQGVREIVDFRIRVACRTSPELWTNILRGWDRQSVAGLLKNCRAWQFDYAWSALGDADKHCPGWLSEVGKHVSWNDFEKVLSSADPGDLRSVCEVFAALQGPALKRLRSSPGRE